ncbi:MAG: hotdog fold thioesterase [Actinophytocola sp.]|nr:hotdog fold thioesterase [Actinophytocola sp.]
MHDSARWWIEEVLAGSPVASQLGVRVVTAERERIRIRLPFGPHLVTVADVVHGGVIATLIDIAGACASASGIDDQTATGGATSELSVSYLDAARGCDLLADATVVHRTRGRTLTDVLVRDDNGTLMAKATVTSRIFHRPASPAQASDMVEA